MNYEMAEIPLKSKPMELRVIELNTDKSANLYASDDCQTLLNSYDDYYKIIGFNPPWIGYFIIRDHTIVGTCGFTGKPQEGKVEIAYWTFSAFEGQGIASFACKELVSISQKNDANITVTANTAPEENASTKILKNNGFQFTGMVQDHEIGDAWLWVL
jgi:RimJ/RimL family protein N-acetyltransferase